MATTCRAVERAGVVSLRFDADPDDQASYCADLVEQHRLSAFTTTESRSRRLARAMRRRLPAGWRVLRRHEYLLCFDTAVWGKRSHAKLRTLSALTYGGRRFRMAEVELRHRATKLRARLQSAHAPRSIGGGHTRWRWVERLRVRAAQRGWASWGEHNARLHRRRPDRVVLSHMDANLDQRSAHWRSYLAGELGAPSVYDRRRPTRGTKGTRLIDTAHVFGAAVVGGPWVSGIPRPAGIDHAAMFYAVELEVQQ